MDDKKILIFDTQSNKDLFKSEVLIGKKVKTKQYKDIFKNEKVVKVLKDIAINETFDAFIKGSLNLTTTSNDSYLHRNTLIYRIKKVRKAIGLDFRKFEDCLVYINMREVYKLVKHDV